MSGFTISDQAKKQIRFYVTTGASLFTSLALFETLKYQNRLLKNKRERNIVEKGQITKPGDVKNIQKGALVMVSGVINTLDKKHISKRINNKNQALAIYLKYKQTIFSNESYNLSKNDYHINLKEVIKGSQLDYNTTITLNDNYNGVLVKNLDKIDFSPALDILKWENKKRDLTLFQNLNVFFMAVLRGAATVAVKDNNVTFLRGVNVGNRQVQSGIRIGATLTVLGSLGITSEGVVFVEPSAIFKERLSHLGDLKDEFEELVSKRNVWFAAFLIGAVYVGRRVFNYVKKNNIKMPWEKKEEQKQMNQF